MKTRLFTFILASFVFVFAGCDDDDDSNNDNNVNNNNINNTNSNNNNTNNATNNNNNTTSTTNNTTAECGNGVVEGDEACDTDAPAGTCVEMGFEGGDLACAADCTVDYSGCTVGDGAVGSSCFTEADCSVEGLTSECHHEVANPMDAANPFVLNGGYCSAACDINAETDECAASNGECFANAMLGIDGMCFDLCDPAASDCRAGYECQNLGGESNYCLPLGM